MGKANYKLRIAVLAFALGIGLVGDAWAIPAFARKYKTSCATCHEAFPRLNAVGEAFRLNGYKFVDDEMYIKEEPVEMGDESYKKVWPRAIWPSDIPGQLPVAVIVQSDFTVDLGNTKKAGSTFIFPKKAKILGAGSLGDRMSFFAEFGFTKGGGHEGGDPNAVETTVEGWLQFEDLFGKENFFNFRLGTVGMQELGLFTGRDHNRFSVNPYLYSSWTMPDANDSKTEAALAGLLGTGAAFTQANEFIVHAQPGVELNGFGKRWRYAVGLTNGNGEKVYDNNSQKDVYGQFAYKIGGRGFDGSSGKEDESLGGGSGGSWVDNSLTLSAFAYSGSTVIELKGANSTWTSNDNFWRVGVGALGRYKNLQVGGGYVLGKNSAPYGALTGTEVDSTSWFVEAQYFVFPWLIPNFRYEGLNLKLPENVAAILASQDQQRAIFGIKFLPRANVSANLEARIYTENERRADKDDDNQLVFSFTYAF